MVILSAFVPLYHVHIVPTEIRRRCQPPLEAESQMVVKHQVGAWNQTWVLCKRIKCSSLVKCLSKSDCYMVRKRKSPRWTRFVRCVPLWDLVFLKKRIKGQEGSK